MRTEFLNASYIGILEKKMATTYSILGLYRDNGNVDGQYEYEHWRGLERAIMICLIKRCTKSSCGAGL